MSVDEPPCEPVMPRARQVTLLLAGAALAGSASAWVGVWMQGGDYSLCLQGATAGALGWLFGGLVSCAITRVVSGRAEPIVLGMGGVRCQLRPVRIHPRCVARCRHSEPCFKRDSGDPRRDRFSPWKVSQPHTKDSTESIGWVIETLCSSTGWFATQPAAGRRSSCVPSVS